MMQIGQFKNAQTTFFYNKECVTSNIENLFNLNFWKEKNAIIGSAIGRGTTWFVQAEMDKFAIRHYYRGGLFGKLVKDKYLFTDIKKTRAYQEFSLLGHLTAKGLAVPKPIAIKISTNGCFYSADIITEYLANSSDLNSILQQRKLSVQEYLALGALVKKLHRLKVNHTDLNIHNILQDQTGKFWLIDFDKCYVSENLADFSKNLARLHRSFIKEQERFNINWQDCDWQSFLQGYNEN